MTTASIWACPVRHPVPERDRPEDDGGRRPHALLGFSPLTPPGESSRRPPASWSYGSV
jgi:hypothetical protein